MTNLLLRIAVLASLLFLAYSAYDNVLHYNGEKYFKSVKQLTFGGSNAEGYFSFDDKKLTLQAAYKGSTSCDQIYQIDLTIDPKQQTPKRMSTGLGATTCSFFMGDNEHFLYAGTFHKLNSSLLHRNATEFYDTCPKKKCRNLDAQSPPELVQLCNTSYTWDIYREFDIFLADKYGNIVKQLTNEEGYDAEGVVSPDGKHIAFTSMRSGDLELWIMDVDGSNPRQVTNGSIGYDGGSFFSPDGKKLIFRASRPKTPEAIAKYKALLRYDLVAPTDMELFVINVDGTGERQITNLGGANWAPYYLHDGKRIIFSSDWNNTAGFGAFDLWVINEDGTGLDRVTWDDNMFDSFPMMSYDGTKLVWGSSRNAGDKYDLNLFLAEWTDDFSGGASSLSLPLSLSFLVTLMLARL